ncbi:MAG: hypothetical protein HY787_24875 [Deltaproteobacteria bacterium]|nr:hypothetical protein [Deltaproteobacteria bacterium]
MKKSLIFFMLFFCSLAILFPCLAGNPWDFSETMRRADEANQRDEELRLRRQQIEIDRQFREEQLRLQRQELEFREAERRRRTEFEDERRRQKEKEDEAIIQRKEGKKPPSVFNEDLKPILIKAHPDYQEIIRTREYWEWLIKQSPALLVAGASSPDPQDMIWALSRYKEYRSQNILIK